MITKMECSPRDKDIVTVTEDHGLVVQNKEGMGRRTRATTNKMFIEASSKIKQIKDSTKNMDKLEEQAPEMIKRMG